MLEDILVNDTISGGFGAIPIQTEKMKTGLRFSQPSMENGVSVIAKGFHYIIYF